MNLVQYIIEFLLLGLAFLGGSYFRKKGENQATKEDIGEITESIEGVKQGFINQIEVLKSELQLIINIQAGIVAEERIAIIDFNLKYFRWLNLLMDTSMNAINMFDDEELAKYELLLSNCYKDYLDSETKFHLFVENSTLSRVSNSLKTATLKSIEPYPSDCIFKLKINNSEIKKLKANPDTPLGFSHDYDLLLRQREIIRDKFREKIIEGFLKISTLTNEFQKLSRQHIYRPIERPEIDGGGGEFKHH